MNLDELIPLSVPVIYLIMFISEARLEGRTFPKVKQWKIIGVIFFILLLVLSLLMPIVLPLSLFKSYSIFDLTHLDGSGVLLGLVVTTFITYWFHRAEHFYNLMWKSFHQIHHSAERVDMAGAFYTHPLEVIVKMSIAALVSIFILGLNPVVIATVSTVTGLLSMLQHWNIKTPHWIGYVVQRPESHCFHHEFNKHSGNYGDLPIWDMIFGTYYNPVGPVNIKVGLGADKIPQLKKMLSMKLVD